MKQVTMREFAALCRSDPELYAQTVAIPNTITPEKVFSLAARNGYRIVREREAGNRDQIVQLDDDELDQISGGTDAVSQQEQWNALHTWIYHVMGFGDDQPKR